MFDPNMFGGGQPGPGMPPPRQAGGQMMPGQTMPFQGAPNGQPSYSNTGAQDGSQQPGTGFSRGMMGFGSGQGGMQASTLQRLQQMQMQLNSLIANGGSPLDIMNLQTQMQFLRDNYNRGLQNNAYRRGMRIGGTVGTNGRGGDMSPRYDAIRDFMMMYGL